MEVENTSSQSRGVIRLVLLSYTATQGLGVWAAQEMRRRCAGDAQGMRMGCVTVVVLRRGSQWLRRSCIQVFTHRH